MRHHKDEANPFLTNQALQRRLMVFIYDFRLKRDGNRYPWLSPRYCKGTKGFMKRDWNDAIWKHIQGSF